MASIASPKLPERKPDTHYSCAGPDECQAIPLPSDVLVEHIVSVWNLDLTSARLEMAFTNPSGENFGKACDLGNWSSGGRGDGPSKKLSEVMR